MTVSDPPQGFVKRPMPQGCTHRGGPLGEGELDGSVVTCPWHGAQFDVTTGQVIGPPAPQSVPAYKVVVEGNVIKVEVT